MDDLDEKEAKQLQFLGLFHSLVAALWVMVAVIPIVYLMTGVEIVEGRFDGGGGLDESAGWTVVLWSLASAAMSLVMAVLTFVAGRRLTQRRARSFCITVAAINCFFVPVGTVLGILTITVLKRPDVRRAFVTKPPHPNVAAWEDTKLP